MKLTKPLLIAVVALAGLASSSPVAAQNGGSSSTLYGVGFPAGAKLLAQADVPIQVSGQLTVAFHGDAATGCAASGLCSYSGTILYRTGSGDLGIETYRRHGRITRVAFLALAPGVGSGGNTTVAEVARSVAGQPAALCADGESPFTGGGPSATIRGGKLTLALLQPGGSLLSTRCAGPLDGDLAGAGPRATISLRAALRGRTTIDMKGSEPFASHGFAGTVTSTLVLTLGKPYRPASAGFPPGTKTERIRTVTERLSVVREAGQLNAAVQGTADPTVCRLLDSCGVSGTLGLALPAARGGVGALTAIGPASRPYADFVAALDHIRSDRGSGIAVIGSVAWTNSGRINANLTQSGTCSDAAPLGGFAVGLLPAGEHTGAFVGSSSWRTRCPGPIVSGEGQTLSASQRVRLMGPRTLGVTLRPFGSLSDDGYTVTLHGHLSLVLRRGRITQQVATEPTG